MYLDGRMYMSKYDKSPEYKKISELFNKEIGELKGIEFEVMYWRKANWIHKWFVDNVQNGNDDCGDYHVHEEVLTKLRDTISEVLTNKNPELLPPQSGFFFGNTEINDYYYQSLSETLERLNFILSSDLFKEIDFYYSSSW